MYTNNEKSRVLILDMDGTIADTYNYPDWVSVLRGHVKDPWTECGYVDPQKVFKMFLNVNPMISTKELCEFCSRWDEVVVWSMTPWDATPEVEQATVNAKIIWLDKYFPFLKNILITKHQNNKNWVHEDNTLYRHIEFERECWEVCWSPSTEDTLCDDSQVLRDSFIGHKMLPPWINHLKL